MVFTFGAALAKDVNISVLDATIKDKNLGGVEVMFQKEGQSSKKITTNSNGKASLEVPFGSDDNSVMMILKKDGYSTMAVKCPCDDFVYAMSPTLKNLDGLRVVLSWGKEPTDMDLHAVSSDDKHIYWYSRGSGATKLDVDDRDGYGPETITIENIEFGKEWIFFVHNFSASKRDNNLKNVLGEFEKYELADLKNARIFVYMGDSLVRTYEYPALPQNLINGNLWIPFLIDSEGKIVDKNILADTNHKNKKMLTKDFTYNFMKKYLSGESSLVISKSDIKEAKRLNNLGVKSYKAKDYSTAIMHYNNSISLNPNDDDGQTYSNLGLAYQKAGNLAEAIWANRKAIDLANGKGASVIKANSYYNIGRIYEEQGELQQALNNYQNADSNNPKKTYKEAIERIKSKMK